jgi:hypothetical protein
MPVVLLPLGLVTALENGQGFPASQETGSIQRVVV